MGYRDDIAGIGNPDARLAETLRQGAMPGGTQVLFDALWDSYAPLRHAAATALAAALEPPWPARLADLLDAVDREPDEVRRAAALALANPTVAGAPCERLAEAVRSDRDDVVRYHAFLALYECASAEQLREVTGDALRDEDPGVTVVASQIATENGWKDLVPDLFDAFDRLGGKDRFQIALSLSELVDPTKVTEEMVDVLLAGLRDEKTLAAACMALGRLGAGRAVEPLRKVMSSFFAHPLNRVEAAAALVKLGDATGREYLGKMLDGRRKDTRGYALELVATLGLDEFREQVEATARGAGYHAETAVSALRKFGDARALETLREIADSHPDPEIRELAAETSAVDGTLRSD